MQWDPVSSLENTIFKLNFFFIPDMCSQGHKTLMLIHVAPFFKQTLFSYCTNQELNKGCNRILHPLDLYDLCVGIAGVSNFSVKSAAFFTRDPAATTISSSGFLPMTLGMKSH